MKHRTYLTASAAGALGVLNGHRPLIRRGWASIPGFTAGWVDSELPLARLATHGALVAAATRGGLLRTHAGKAATLLNAASAAGLLHLHRVGQRSDAVLEAALVDELGRDYRERMVWSPACRPQEAPIQRRQVPFALGGQRRRYVSTDGRDVAYGEAGRRNHLDVWRRADLRYDWLNRHQTNHDEFIPWIEKRVIKRSVADARDVFDRASPLGRIRPDAPPFLVLHGANDSLVKVEQARSFADELRKTSNAHVVYAELPTARHAFDSIRSPHAIHTAHAVERFLAVAYGEHRQRQQEEQSDG